MTDRIGFFGQEEKQTSAPVVQRPQEVQPRPSVVRVLFERREMTLAYYNDRFDLTVGDTVFVEGKLAGERGRVVEVHHRFKIRPSDYKRVLSVADTCVHGDFFSLGAHFVTETPRQLPPETVRSWFRAGGASEEHILCGEGDAFLLSDLHTMQVKEAAAQRGHEYYVKNLVRYLSLEDGRGFAIVEGKHPYEVEFTYRDGMIFGPVCDCPCFEPCKHIFAVMLQLRELFDLMERHCPDKQTDCFAAVYKPLLYKLVLNHPKARFSL